MPGERVEGFWWVRLRVWHETEPLPGWGFAWVDADDPDPESPGVIHPLAPDDDEVIIHQWGPYLGKEPAHSDESDVIEAAAQRLLTQQCIEHNDPERDVARSECGLCVRDALTEVMRLKDEKPLESNWVNRAERDDALAQSAERRRLLDECRDQLRAANAEIERLKNEVLP